VETTGADGSVAVTEGAGELACPPIGGACSVAAGEVEEVSDAGGSVTVTEGADELAELSTGGPEPAEGPGTMSTLPV
jgi:hypothetical protein